jgi:hypothetical protein
MIRSLLNLHLLGEAVDVADIPVMIVVGHVEGRQVARGSDVATRGGWGATQRHRLQDQSCLRGGMCYERRRNSFFFCAADNFRIGRCHGNLPWQVPDPRDPRAPVREQPQKVLGVEFRNVE